MNQHKDRKDLHSRSFEKLEKQDFYTYQHLLYSTAVCTFNDV